MHCLADAYGGTRKVYHERYIWEACKTVLDPSCLGQCRDQIKF